MSLVSMMINTTLLVIFVRNSLVASKYIRCAKIKNKALFKALLLSQLIATSVFVPMVLNFFTLQINCISLARFAVLANALSMGILLTGILAVKAYRCLENSKWVLGVAVLLRTCATTAVLVSIPKLDASRRLTGN
jgi:hypothetical protein